MKRLGRESLRYTIDYQHPAALTVELGEPFMLDTEDVPSGLYRNLDDAARLLDAWYLNHYPPMQSHHREGMSPTPVVPALPVSISRNCFGRIPDLIAFTKALSIPRSESLDFAAPIPTC